MFPENINIAWLLMDMYMDAILEAKAHLNIPDGLSLSLQLLCLGMQWSSSVKSAAMSLCCVLQRCKQGTMVVQVAATDADDPTYGNSARVIYSIIHGQPYFSVEPRTGSGYCVSSNSDRVAQLNHYFRPPCRYTVLQSGGSMVLMRLPPSAARADRCCRLEDKDPRVIFIIPLTSPARLSLRRYQRCAAIAFSLLARSRPCRRHEHWIAGTLEP
ncbi:unnamed protein product [Boreogadus saida]